MAQIYCKDVSLGYDGCTVSEHVNFSVNAGDYLCIVGDNGSGKSTLMKALLRLKAPEGGEILLGDGVARRDIGYLPQQSEAQKDFPASVREVVLSGCVGANGFRCFLNKTDRAVAQENMKRLGVDHLASRSYRELSGGQQQRVLLERALCAAGRILLLDEPVSGLDPQATEELYETIAHLNRAHAVTILMVTHDLSAVVRYANRVLHMSKKPTFYESVAAYCASEDFPGGKEADHA